MTGDLGANGTPRDQRIPEHELRVGVLVRFTPKRRDGSSERGAAAAGRMAEATADRHELVDGHQPPVEQLVDDGPVIELAEVAGKIERQAGPRRHHDAVGSPHPVRLGDDRGLPESRADNGIETPSVQRGEVQHRVRLAPQATEHPGGRPGDEAGGMGATQHATAVLERRRGGRECERAAFETAEEPGVDQPLESGAPDAEDRNVDVVTTPWWSTSQRARSSGRWALAMGTPPRVGTTTGKSARRP